VKLTKSKRLEFLADFAHGVRKSLTTVTELGLEPRLFTFFGLPLLVGLLGFLTTNVNNSLQM
jgi:hypothetical protein